MMDPRCMYMLDDNNNPILTDIETFKKSFDEKRRIIKQQNVSGCLVSTIFLTIDHRWGDEGKPILFETMIFTKRKGNFKKLDQWQQRFCSYDDALACHKAVVNRIQRKELGALL